MTDISVTETHTVPSQDYVSNFFTKIPTDARFVRVSYVQITPFTAIDKSSDKVQFIFDTLKSPMCYLLDEMLISCQVSINAYIYGSTDLLYTIITYLKMVYHK